MSEEIVQNASQTQSQRERRMFSFLKMFSFMTSLLDVIKVIIASVASVVFLGFAGLTFAGSAVALTVTTPLFVIFSPILVPATIITTVLTTGFTAGGTLGLTAASLIMSLIINKMGVKPMDNAFPAGASSSAQDRLNVSGGYGGSWGGKTFSGTFGDKSAGGKSFSSKMPEWLKNTPWFSGAPAGAATPPAGTPPAAEATPAGGSTPTG